MQQANFNRIDFGGGEKAAPRATREVREVPWTETDFSIERQLLTAAQDAEPVTAFLYGMHCITSPPLLLIWDKLDWVIRFARRWLQFDDQHPTSRAIDLESQGGES